MVHIIFKNKHGKKYENKLALLRVGQVQMFSEDLPSHKIHPSPTVPIKEDGKTVPSLQSATFLLDALPRSANNTSATLPGRSKFKNTPVKEEQEGTGTGNSVSERNV